MSGAGGGGKGGGDASAPWVAAAGSNIDEAAAAADEAAAAAVGISDDMYERKLLSEELASSRTWMVWCAPLVRFDSIDEEKNNVSVVAPTANITREEERPMADVDGAVGVHQELNPGRATCKFNFECAVASTSCNLFSF